MWYEEGVAVVVPDWGSHVQAAHSWYLLEESLACVGWDLVGCQVATTGLHSVEAAWELYVE